MLQWRLLLSLVVGFVEEVGKEQNVTEDIHEERDLNAKREVAAKVERLKTEIQRCKELDLVQAKDRKRKKERLGRVKRGT